jgi:CubicO group peptidase (beta-lactamase class C family)
VLDSRFFQACEAAAIEWDVPALAVGVSVGGQAETFAAGCAVETVFRVASVTKPFTATLALELLDPQAATGVWPGDVRVRHLLAHTSGYDCELRTGDQARFGVDHDALGAQIKELPAVRRFVGVEQCWSYANTGFWLAGWLAAEQAGLSFEDALTRHVLAPAGLESTSFGEAELAGSGAKVIDGPYPRARRPSGGLVSNVPDLLRFGAWHLAQPRSAQMRIVHGKPTAGVYGLGMFGERVGEVEVWGHGGSYGGFESSLLVVPDRDAVFAGLTNASRGSKALRTIEDEFFERLLGARRRVPEVIELPVDAREAFTGSFANSDGWIEVALSETGLTVTLDEGEFPAQAIDERTFEITSGEHIHERFDFPLEGFGRFGSRLAERVE